MRWFIAACMVLSFGGLSSCSLDSSSGSGEDLTDEYYLKDTCKDWVKDKLKAPSTADFGGESVDGGPDADGYFTVSGYVDAENGFGANIRADWTCDIRVNASNDGWEGNAQLLE